MDNAESIKFFNMELGPNREFLIELDVSGLPTFLFYKNGRQWSSLAGRNILMDEIQEHIDRLLQT
jgi:thiol:disulfide interchange protein